MHAQAVVTRPTSLREKWARGRGYAWPCPLYWHFNVCVWISATVCICIHIGLNRHQNYYNSNWHATEKCSGWSSKGQTFAAIGVQADYSSNPHAKSHSNYHAHINISTLKICPSGHLSRMPFMITDRGGLFCPNSSDTMACAKWGIFIALIMHMHPLIHHGYDIPMRSRLPWDFTAAASCTVTRRSMSLSSRGWRSESKAIRIHSSCVTASYNIINIPPPACSIITHKLGVEDSIHRCTCMHVRL